MIKSNFKQLIFIFLFTFLFVFQFVYAIDNYEKGEIIVKYKTYSVGSKKSISRSLEKLNQKYAIKSSEPVFTEPNILVKSSAKMKAISANSNVQAEYRLNFSEKFDAKEVAEDFSKDSNIEYAEPNYIYNLSSVKPNDPAFNGQWALAKIDATDAWAITTGNTNVIVSVIDTGVDYNHNDLKNNMWINSAEIPDNKIDDDGNGYIDDVKGWNFSNQTNDPIFDVNDSNYEHGTHCAGIIGAEGNNNLGVSGEAWNIKIMPLKVFSGNHTNSFLLAKAIQYSAYNGAKVINCSFGGYQYSSILKKAVDYARSLGAIVVAGVGNDNSSNYFYPAGYDGVLSVGATASDDQKADFSNYGDWVNVFAPGDKICSTLPNNAYGNLSGTSMACPFVSGLAGLLIAKEPELTNDEIIERIKNYSDNIDSVNALYAGKLGSGRINAYKVLAKTNYNLNITTVASDIKQVKVYPNPFDPQKDNQGMRIENIAPKTEIKIYNVLGQLVKKLEDADENGYEFWNGKNDANNIVASGVYIMFLKNGTEIKKIKIAVEK